MGLADELRSPSLSKVLLPSKNINILYRWSLLLMGISKIALFIVLSGLSALSVMPAQAVFFKEKRCVGVIASVDGYANIREQPTTASRIRGTLNKGADVDVYSVVENAGKYWYRVNRGYIRANQIRRDCAGSGGKVDFPYP